MDGEIKSRQDGWLSMKIPELLARHPYVADFLALVPVQPEASASMADFLDGLPETVVEDMGVTRPAVIRHFIDFMTRMHALTQEKESLRSLTIIGGFDKNGAPETAEVNIPVGTIASIVGPTGSGKSRLLADIEWIAQQDTPTKRTILLNGRRPQARQRFSAEDKLVAQLSQNMNFVMDLTVEEFVNMHAESRMVSNAKAITRQVIAKANELAGEPFSADSAVTALSGGQSRALMLADAALLSICPVVLIDELENAGIDRRQALQLLIDKQKIVLMATHDPILALLGDMRLIIKNGGISQVIYTSEAERHVLASLEKMDRQLSAIRAALRNGQRIDSVRFPP